MQDYTLKHRDQLICVRAASPCASAGPLSSGSLSRRGHSRTVWSPCVSCYAWWGWSSDWRPSRTPGTCAASPLWQERDHRMSARSHFYARWRVGLFFFFFFCTLCLTCVDERVFLHVWLLVEPLPAVLARVGPRVRVDEQVRGQRGGALEAFAADFTAEAPLL